MGRSPTAACWPGYRTGDLDLGDLVDGMKLD
jgi:hypothetical protein